MEIKISYGRSFVKVNIQDDISCRLLEQKKIIPLDNPASKVEEAIKNPCGSLPLAELAGVKRKACIVVSDITRPVPNKIILPPILQTLEAQISRENIVILVATGLHRPNKGAELDELLGSEIARKYRIVNHDARDRTQLTFIEETKDKIPVLLNKYYCEADLRILTGLIEPHFMAGFSGGRKAICPGIAGEETIKMQHSPAFLESPYSAIGNLKNNPFHKLTTTIAKLTPPDFIVNVTLDDERRITGVVAGGMEKAFLEGVKILERYAVCYIDKPADVAITSGGGYPLDTTFYQSIKGIVTAGMMVKKGGAVIIAASCSDGVGGREFTDLITRVKSEKEFMKIIKKSYVIDQWQIEELYKTLRKAEVYFYTGGIKKNMKGKLLVKFTDSIEKTMQKMVEKHGSKLTVAVLPVGPYVIPRVGGNPNK